MIPSMTFLDCQLSPLGVVVNGVLVLLFALPKRDEQVAHPLQ